MRLVATLLLIAFIVGEYSFGFGFITRWTSWYLAKPQIDGWHNGGDKEGLHNVLILTAAITAFVCAMLEALIFIALVSKVIYDWIINFSHSPSRVCRILSRKLMQACR